jgi:sodium transport system permease protein
MSWRLTLHVYRKEGLEILRDRRTLFVNLVLPVLMYPLALMFMLQVTQIVHSQPPPTPKVILDVPAALIALVPQPPAPLASATAPAPATAAAPTTATETAPSPAPAANAATADTTATPSSSASSASADDDDDDSDHQKPIPRYVRAITAPPAVLDVLRAAARDLAGTQDPEAEPGKRDHVPKGDIPDAARARALAALRSVDAVEALVQIRSAGRAPQIVALRDDAEGQSANADAVLGTAINAWQRQEVRAGLARAGIDKAVLNPVTLADRDLAPRAEALRAHAASFLPILLVLLATSAAMIPAVDLLAGERERGTLETLLSWPVPRRSLFTGKLLVVGTSALVAVALNLLSLAVTMAVGAGQIAHTSGDLGSIFAVGGSTLLLCFVVLLPLTATVSALALAITGLAASTKEASNYLSPLLLVVLFAALVCLMPDAHPSLALDLVPVTGPVLALREALEGHAIPWRDLGFSFVASVVLAVVVIGWAARLLDDERFRYPGLVRAGWGRFRVWGPAPGGPGGLEAMAVYALAVGGFILAGAYFQRLPPALLVIMPLVLFVLIPALADLWAGDHPLASIRLRLPRPRAWPGALLIGLGAVLVSMLIEQAQQPFVDSASEGKIHALIDAITAAGGLPLLVATFALAPGICEETLCRGTLLSGMERGVGRGAAVVVSACLFALLHLDPARFFPQFVLGMVLALLAQRTGSILPGMLVHALHNGIVVGTTLIAEARMKAFTHWADDHAAPVAGAMLVLGLAGIALGLKLAGVAPPSPAARPAPT